MATWDDTGSIAKKNISDLVTCPLCLEYYQRPKLLSCGHSVCQECLLAYIDKTSKNGTILCPLCRTSISLPESGVDGLTHSFLIVRLQDEYNKVPVNRPCDPCAEDGDHSTAKRKCFECSEYLCEDCTKAHRKVSFSKKHEIISIGENNCVKDESEKIPRVSRIKCIKHHDETVRYFCLPCQILICRDCKALDHTDHKAVTFQEATKGKRGELSDNIVTLNKRVTELSATVDQLSQNVSTLKTKLEALVLSVNAERTKHILVLNQAADKMINEAGVIIFGEIKAQKKALKKAQFLKTQIESQIFYTDFLSTKGSDVEVLQDYNMVKGRYKSLTSELMSVPDLQFPTFQSKRDSESVARLETHFTLNHSTSAKQADVHSSRTETVRNIRMTSQVEELKEHERFAKYAVILALFIWFLTRFITYT